MFVLVHHTVHDPATFWATAAAAMPKLPRELTLHQTLSASDGTLATCLWEADSVDAVRAFLEPAFGAASSNEYRRAENRDGIAVPARFGATVAAV
jgi:hypothetical protein